MSIDPLEADGGVSSALSDWLFGSETGQYTLGKYHHGCHSRMVLHKSLLWLQGLKCLRHFQVYVPVDLQVVADHDDLRHWSQSVLLMIVVRSRFFPGGQEDRREGVLQESLIGAGAGWRWLLSNHHQ